MSHHFAQLQVELDRLGYEHTTTNTNGGQTWEHGCGHSLVIYPNLKESQHRSILRTCHKRVGVKETTNKRKTAQIKQRQAKHREIDREAVSARMAWLGARIRELEMAARMRALDAKQRRLLDERMRELRELDRMMKQTPESTTKAAS